MITCSPAIPSDYPAIKELLFQLGYDLSLEEIATNSTEIEKRGGNVFVARISDEIVGCVAAIIDARLAGGMNGEIVSLVVSEFNRGKGIGQKLVSTAESWLSKKVNSVRVRANIKRELAHEFYIKAGYEFSKSQKVFKKVL